ncbi:hypothetical protein BC831DRAFT_495406 [Entophlyctis helioformis]|nr:hypothetical protein BC831DRAFT_495406 [Entophlyctis helioformis]
MAPKSFGHRQAVVGGAWQCGHGDNRRSKGWMGWMGWAVTCCSHEHQVTPASTTSMGLLAERQPGRSS